jgi:hypothetical protein
LTAADLGTGTRAQRRNTLPPENARRHAIPVDGSNSRATPTDCRIAVHESVKRLPALPDTDRRTISAGQLPSA